MRPNEEVYWLDKKPWGAGLDVWRVGGIDFTIAATRPGGVSGYPRMLLIAAAAEAYTIPKSF